MLVATGTKLSLNQSAAGSVFYTAFSILRQLLF